MSKMSEAEARSAALQATAQHTADPFAANGVQSAGMTALYQKIISDPAYAKKFEKMSEAEKETELRKYMANDKPVAITPDQMKARETQMATQNRQVELIRNAQEIQLKLSDFMQKVSEVSTSFGHKLQEIEQQGRTHEAISAEVQKTLRGHPDGGVRRVRS
ncbi:MAG: hypothetical protein IPM82_27320 [Saprospiraceae bacterium]|nr:hypothetical protein [Saprospiraceae bacterium]